jgi:glycosyltransferase involved in cell wall biosynthesis
LPSFHETQGIVLLEANACGKPVIASNINGIKEVVKQGYNGLLCNPYNPKHIAETINRLFSDTEGMAKMGKNGRQLVAIKYNWSIIAQQTEKVYRQLILDFDTPNEKSTLSPQPISFPIFSKIYP